MEVPRNPGLCVLEGVEELGEVVKVNEQHSPVSRRVPVRVCPYKEYLFSSIECQRKE